MHIKIVWNVKFSRHIDISFFFHLIFFGENFNQRLVEQIELYEVNNYSSVSIFVQFFGNLCNTTPALRDICRFIIGTIFGPYEPNNYYDVTYKRTKQPFASIVYSFDVVWHIFFFYLISNYCWTIHRLTQVVLAICNSSIFYRSFERVNILTVDVKTDLIACHAYVSN